MKIKIFLSLIIMIVLAQFQFNIEASVKGKPIQSNVAKGIYVQKDILTVPKIKQLPVPSTNDNYAFYQAIDKVSNIVIGTFNSGERVITLIQDKNADGKVDTVAHYFIDLNRINLEPKPNEFCNAEKFKKYKEDIVKGNTKDISPNPEGTLYLTELLKTPSNITRNKHGFKVSRTDTDQLSKERVVYFFSYRTTTGADISFEVKYYNRGSARVSPIINIAVYCSKSKDPFAIETARKYMKEIKKYVYD